MISAPTLSKDKDHLPKISTKLIPLARVGKSQKLMPRFFPRYGADSMLVSSLCISNLLLPLLRINLIILISMMRRNWLLFSLMVFMKISIEFIHRIAKIVLVLVMGTAQVIALTAYTPWTTNHSHSRHGSSTLLATIASSLTTSKACFKQHSHAHNATKYLRNLTYSHLFH